jgi:hypothetical protein
MIGTPFTINSSNRQNGERKLSKTKARKFNYEKEENTRVRRIWNIVDGIISHTICTSYRWKQPD